LGRGNARAIRRGVSRPAQTSRWWSATNPATKTAAAQADVSRVLAKLGARDRTQAVIAAYEAGLTGRGAGVS
jgi:hypothetical protein